MTKGHHSIALKILSYYIIFFPSIDVCSVYPLVIHTIVNNVYSVIFGRDTSQDKGWKLILIQVSMKFVVAFMPIAIAMFVSNLVYVLKYAGLAGFFIVLFFPIVFQLTSQWVCFKHFRCLRDERMSVKPEEGEEIRKNFSISSSASSSLPKEEYTVQDERTMLLSNDQKQEAIGSMVKEFFFSLRAQILSQTPYSTFLSHPLIVTIIGCFAMVCFVMSLVSLSVPTNSQTLCAKNISYYLIIINK